MNWFKRAFAGKKAKKISLEDISAAMAALSQTLSDSDGGIKKGLRRLSLAQKQQSDAIDTLSRESRTLKSTIADRHGVVLTYTQIIRLLDHLDKIQRTVDPGEVIGTLLTRVTEDLLSLCELEAIAEVHSLYPAEGCEVIGAIEEPKWQAGTVHEILQQGYRDSNGQIVRGAKVVVCREEQQRGLSQQLTTTGGDE
jgi:molecular chaperone GrpE (heat shock protein)